jgi:zinc transport system ATP-binding protein
MSHPAAPVIPPGSPAVSYEGVSFSYAHSAEAQALPALQNITLRVEPGERLGILGPNGGGKSTLLKLTLGLLHGYTGRISIFGLSPQEARRRRLIGYVPQRIEAELAFPLSVRQVVQMSAGLGSTWWRPLPREVREDVARSLELVGAAALAERPIGKLSGGQLQRVMIARALACRPRLLLLDEPTVGIDVAGQQRFADLLRTLHDELRLTIMVVSHDIRTIAAGSDRVACLSRTLHSHVAPEGLTPRVLAEVFSHDVAAIFGDVHVDAHLAEECPAGGEHGHSHGHSHIHPHVHPHVHSHGPACDHGGATPPAPATNTEEGERP